MKIKIRNKLFSLLKLCIFNVLATVSLHAYAEYYLVYSAPEPSDQCTFCQSKAHKTPSKPRAIVSKKPHSVHAHHKYHSRGGLYVYYPGNLRPACPCNEVWTNAYCQCCPHPNRVRTQWGDYVVFSSGPADRTSGIPDEEESSYNPDMTTTDDGGSDLEIN